MWRWITAAVAMASLRLGILMAPPAQASHLPGKTIVLLGSIGRNAGETPWQLLREQLAMRGFPAADVVEFQYAGGAFGPDGSYTPNPGRAVRELLEGVVHHAAAADGRPEGSASRTTRCSWSGTASAGSWRRRRSGASRRSRQDARNLDQPERDRQHQRPDGRPEHSRRTPFEFANAGGFGCVDQSMVVWMEEVGDPPERYAHGRAAGRAGRRSSSATRSARSATRSTARTTSPRATSARRSTEIAAGSTASCCSCSATSG